MDAFLFDLDGLLVDSEPLHFEAFTSICLNYGLTVPWDFKTYCQKAHTQSMGLKTATLELLPEAETIWPELYHKVKLKFAELVSLKPLPLMPGVSQFLELIIAKGKKIAVVTNSSSLMVMAILDKQPMLGQIPLWITREDYHHAKPAPDGYLKALDTLKISKDRACGFEDSPRGLKALKASGLRAFFISSHHEYQQDHFASFTQLLTDPCLKQILD
jgi:HAD superfamily hydrolase (TIGR01509 family)